MCMPFCALNVCTSLQNLGMRADIMTRERVTTMRCVWALVAGAAVGGSEARHYGGGGWSRRNHPHSLFVYNNNKPLATFHARPTSLIESLLNVRGGNDETLNDERPYHLLSVLPATTSPTDDKKTKDHWLPPGCTALTTTTAKEAAITMHWGNPDVWQSTNLALVESLALMSEVVVLTLTDPDDDAVTTDVAKALQRGWQRRLAQGLTPGRLWVVWTDNSNSIKHKNKKEIKDQANEWMSQLVSNEWTAELSTPSKSPDLIADWKLCHGPIEYTTAIREFVLQQEGQENNDKAPLVPVEGIPTLLRQVYNMVGKSHSTKVTFDNQLFLSMPVVSELPAMIAASLKEALPATNKDEKQQPASTSTSAGDEPLPNQDYGQNAESADATNVWLAVELVQNQLDEYWLADSKSGISMPPDMVKAIAPILPSPRDKKQATMNDKDLALLQQRLVSLAEQHAGILRDYYGRLYESLLDNGRANDKSASSLSKQYQSVAQRVTKTMQRYVEENLKDIYQVSYQGLQEDFLEIMDRWKSTADVLFEDEEDMEDDGTTTASSRSRIRLPPWLKRLSVRILVLGVNYLQGWLAWQGAKRAALARERQMPKFPLF